MTTQKHVFFLFLLLFISQLAHSQTVVMDTSKFSGKMILSLNPLAFFGNGLELNFERKVKNNLTLRYTVGYYLAEKPFYYEFYNGFNGLKIEIQPRFYVRRFDKSRKGTYFSPYFQYKHINLYKDISYLIYTGNPPEERSVTERNNTFASTAALGFLVGTQHLSLASRFTIDVFIGSGFVIPLNQYERNVPHLFLINPYEQGIFFKAGTSIGLAFN